MKRKVVEELFLLNIVRILLLFLVGFILYGLFFYRKGKRWQRKHRKLFLYSLILLVAIFSTWPLHAVSEARRNLANQKVTKVNKKNTSTLASTEKETMAKEKTEKLRNALVTAWQEVLSDDKTAQIAIYAPSLSNEVISYSSKNAVIPIKTASIVKLAVATAVYKEVDENLLVLNGDDEIALRDMLEKSDNEDTNYLLRQRLEDTDSLQELFATCKMTSSSPQHSWGTTTTTAEDQVKLLKNIFYEEDFLSANSRDALINHMENVSSDQNWGISKGAGDFALKNGWLDINEYHWIINSIGKVTLENTPVQDYVVAILTDNNATMENGISLVEKLAEVTSQLLSLQE